MDVIEINNLPFNTSNNTLILVLYLFIINTGYPDCCRKMKKKIRIVNSQLLLTPFAPKEEKVDSCYPGTP